MDYIENDAFVSDCEMYRYTLLRRWNENYPAVCFIMLNPSTADASKDDRTITRCVSYARRWGFGALRVCNLSPQRTKNPKQLLPVSDGIIDNNRGWISNSVRCSDATIFAWGGYISNSKQLLEQAEECKLRHKGAMAINVNRDGTPVHPLYQPADAMPILYTSALQWMRDNAGADAQESIKSIIGQEEG